MAQPIIHSIPHWLVHNRSVAPIDNGHRGRVGPAQKYHTRTFKIGQDDRTITDKIDGGPEIFSRIHLAQLVCASETQILVHRINLTRMPYWIL
jgi:hypothetical protein